MDRFMDQHADIFQKQNDQEKTDKRSSFMPGFRRNIYVEEDPRKTQKEPRHLIHLEDEINSYTNVFTGYIWEKA